MEMITLKVKKTLQYAEIPEYATDGSGAFDLKVADISQDSHCAIRQDSIDAFPEAHLQGGNYAIFDTGLAFEIPEGHVMLVFSRSGHGFKNDIRLSNCVGVIDSDYRASVKVKLRNDGVGKTVLSIGDRIAQAIVIPFPKVEFEETDELSSTKRGTGGFGSTGR